MTNGKRGPGRPRKASDGMVHLRVRVPASLLERCERAAEADERSFNQWVCRALLAALTKKGEA